VGVQFIGRDLPLVRFRRCAPPEAVLVVDDGGGGGGRPRRFELSENFQASYSLDIWAFGQLMFETLVGKPLFRSSSDLDNNIRATVHILGGWNEDNLRDVIHEVEVAGIGTVGADLISHCLCPHPEDRPKSMEKISVHPYLKAAASRSRKNAPGLVQVRKFKC